MSSRAYRLKILFPSDEDAKSRRLERRWERREAKDDDEDENDDDDDDVDGIYDHIYVFMALYLQLLLFTLNTLTIGVSYSMHSDLVLLLHDMSNK